MEQQTGLTLIYLQKAPDLCPPPKPTFLQFLVPLNRVLIIHLTNTTLLQYTPVIGGAWEFQEEMDPQREVTGLHLHFLPVLTLPIIITLDIGEDHRMGEMTHQVIQEGGRRQHEALALFPLDAFRELYLIVLIPQQYEQLENSILTEN